MIFLLLLLISSSAFAGQQMQQETPAVGVYYDQNNQAALTVGDFNLFDQNQTYYKLRRYGGGGGRMQLGNSLSPKFDPNFGLNAYGDNGTVILGLDKDEHNAVFPEIGLEFLNGRFSYNTSDKIQDFYEGFVGPSVGIHADIAGCRILPLVRGGGAAGTLGKNGLVPNANLAYGYAGHISCYVLDVSYGQLYLYDKHRDLNMEDLSAVVNIGERFKIGAQMEHSKGLFDQTSYTIMIKNFFE